MDSEKLPSRSRPNITCSKNKDNITHEAHVSEVLWVMILSDLSNSYFRFCFSNRIKLLNNVMKSGNEYPKQLSQLSDN